MNCRSLRAGFIVVPGFFSSKGWILHMWLCVWHAEYIRARAAFTFWKPASITLRITIWIVALLTPKGWHVSSSLSVDDFSQMKLFQSNVVITCDFHCVASMGEAHRLFEIASAYPGLPPGANHMSPLQGWVHRSAGFLLFKGLNFACVVMFLNT